MSNNSYVTSGSLPVHYWVSEGPCFLETSFLWQHGGWRFPENKFKIKLVKKNLLEIFELGFEKVIHKLHNPISSLVSSQNTEYTNNIWVYVLIQYLAKCVLEENHIQIWIKHEKMAISFAPYSIALLEGTSRFQFSPVLEEKNPPEV